MSIIYENHWISHKMQVLVNMQISTPVGASSVNNNSRATTQKYPNATFVLFSYLFLSFLQVVRVVRLLAREAQVAQHTDTVLHRLVIDVTLTNGSAQQVEGGVDEVRAVAKLASRFRSV